MVAAEVVMLTNGRYIYLQLVDITIVLSACCGNAMMGSWKVRCANEIEES